MTSLTVRIASCLTLLLFPSWGWLHAQQIAPQPYDSVLVCPQAFAESFQPWVQLRTKQGHRVVVIHEQEPGKIREAIRTLNQSQLAGQLKYLIIGADVPSADSGVGIPAHLSKAEVNVKWGSEPEIATDNWYADLNDDRIPDLAVGRLTANSVQQLDVIIKKIVDYETRPDPGLWKRKVNFVAGVGGFGAIADTLLERTTKSFISNYIPQGYQASMTYASWRSPFCPDPRRFRNETVNRINDGSLFWVYIGHGKRRALDWIRVPAGVAPILQEGDYRQVEVKQGAPIAIFLSCYAAAFDDPNDCLADQMLRQPNGPVSIIGGSRVTMPYAMAVMSNVMLKECFAEKNNCLGDIFLAAKQKMASEAKDDKDRLLLDSLAKALSPQAGKLKEERFEHLDLMNLVGDPLLKIKHPQQVQVEMDSTVIQGSELAIKLNCPIPGECTLELVCDRGKLTFPSPRRSKFDATDQGMSEMNEVYRKAIDDRWHQQKFKLPAGASEVAFQIPMKANGTCYVRAFVEGTDGFAIGSKKVIVRRKKNDS